VKTIQKIISNSLKEGDAVSGGTRRSHAIENVFFRLLRLGDGYFVLSVKFAKKCFKQTITNQNLLGLKAGTGY